MKPQDDAKLVKDVMKVKGWNQAEVARYLGLTRPRITQIVRYHQNNLHPSSRKLLELLLEEAKKEEP